jgi:hypothetical protein
MALGTLLVLATIQCCRIHRLRWKWFTWDLVTWSSSYFLPHSTLVSRRCRPFRLLMPGGTGTMSFALLPLLLLLELPMTLSQQEPFGRRTDLDDIVFVVSFVPCPSRRPVARRASLLPGETNQFAAGFAPCLCFLSTWSVHMNTTFEARVVLGGFLREGFRGAAIFLFFHQSTISSAPRLKVDFGRSIHS